MHFYFTVKTIDIFNGFYHPIILVDLFMVDNFYSLSSPSLCLPPPHISLSIHFTFAYYTKYLH